MNVFAAKNRGRKGPSSVRVAVVGGGFGGICAGVKLQRAGFDDFVIYEKSAEPGGVWWDNRYPGAEVDTPSHMYSFSFMRHDWSRNYAQQEELLGYMHATIDHFVLRPHFKLNTPVVSVVWNDERQQYAVRTERGQEWFDFVISAVGLLNIPRYPTWPGMDEFVGPMFHTSRWDDSVDLKGKRVAIVGTGSTAIQIVANVASEVSELTVFQREANWPSPKRIVEYTDKQRKQMRNPLRYRWERFVHGYLPRERDWMFNRVNRPGTAANRRGEQASRALVASQLASRPDLQELVLPNYPFMGKRPQRDENYLPALARDNVRLIPKAVQRVTRHGLVDVEGTEHQADVIILSTGFQPSKFLAQLPVTGKNGRSLEDYWDDDPRAFLGCTVPGFPNFFMLYGPNTNGYAILFLLEQEAAYAVRSIQRVLRKGGTSIETRESYLRRYKRWIDRRASKAVWVQAKNYYASASGTVVTQWVDGCALYWALARTLLVPSSVVTRRQVDRSSTSVDERPISAGRSD